VQKPDGALEMKIKRKSEEPVLSIVEASP